MKLFLAILFASTISFSALAVEKKEVCKDVLDNKGQVVKNKNGSVKKECKIIKIHKKFKGTKVPEKK